MINDNQDNDNEPFDEEYDYESILLRNMILGYLDGEIHTNNSCSHYKTNCNIISSCCNEMFPCKRCHNMKKNHKLDLDDIKIIVCRECLTKQSLSEECISCKIKFATYYCSKCKIYDSSNRIKYHCNKCNKCFIGNNSTTFHCDKCNSCLDIHLKDNHICRGENIQDNCAICLDKMTKDSFSIMKCGHILHTLCLSMLLDNDDKCPKCREKIIL